MNREEDLKAICVDVLDINGIEDSFVDEIAETIAIKIMEQGYVRFDTIELDPQKCVQLLATILNGFKAERPLCIVEKVEDNENAQEDSTANGEVSPEAVS